MELVSEKVIGIARDDVVHQIRIASDFAVDGEFRRVDRENQRIVVGIADDVADGLVDTTEVFLQLGFAAVALRSLPVDTCEGTASPTGLSPAVPGEIVR